MLKLFIAFISIITFLLYIFLIIVLIFGGDPGYWLIGVGAFVAYLIGWKVSGGVILSPLSFFVLPDWEIFKTKYKYANGAAIVVGLFIYVLIERYW